MEKFNLTIQKIFTTFIKEMEISPQHADNWPLLEELKSCVHKRGAINESGMGALYKKQSTFFQNLCHNESGQARFIGLLGVFLGDEVHEGLIWNSFTDSYYPNRCLPIEYLKSDNRHKLFNEIFKRLIGDPRQIVREKALERIKRDFSDIFTYRIENFTHEEQYRLLMLINPHNAADKNILTTYLKSSSPDLSSRSAYTLQNNHEKSPIIEGELIDRMSLLRFSSVASFCHRASPHFSKAFSLVTPLSPLSIQNNFTSELTTGPFKEELIDSYRHGLALIKQRKDAQTALLLEGYIKNRELFSRMVDEILNAFTEVNQYVTHEVLKKLVLSTKNIDKRAYYLKASSRFTFPLGLERS